MLKKAGLPIVVALALASCGGDGDEAAERPTTTPRAAASSVRKVTAHFAGGSLRGHCRGARRYAPAVVLESGLGGDQSQLAAVEEHLARRNVVCAYDRAGIGDSDSSLKTTRRVTEVVADLDAFVAAADIDPPHFLVGHSVGGMLVFMYAQAHPDTVAGFVSMNPVPPYKTFIEAARKVESKDEIATELAQYRGENYEDIDSRANERMLTDPLPPAMPYAVMFDEDCDGDAEFCRRIFPPLERTTRALAKVGGGGRFVPAKGAGHNIFETDPELVLKTIDDVLKDAAGN